MKTSGIEEAFSFLKQRCDDVIVKKSILCKRVFLFSNGKIRASEQLESSNLIVFVAAGKRKALGFGNSIDCSALLQACREAKSDAEYAGMRKRRSNTRGFCPRRAKTSTVA